MISNGVIIMLIGNRAKTTREPFKDFTCPNGLHLSELNFSHVREENS